MDRGLGNRTGASDDARHWASDEAADARADRIDARRCSGPACRQDRGANGRGAAVRRRADSLNPGERKGGVAKRRDPRLTAAAKEVAQIASVIGREFDRSLLSKVAGLDDRALDGALHQLMSTQLVVGGG